MISTRAISLIILAFGAGPLLAGEVENLRGPPAADVIIDDPTVALADAVGVAAGLAEPLRILGFDVMPGTTQTLSWSATELFEGVPVSTPVLVVNGALPGPTLCLTAAIHGDELNGIEMVLKVIRSSICEGIRYLPLLMSHKICHQCRQLCLASLDRHHLCTGNHFFRIL